APRQPEKGTVPFYYLSCIFLGRPRGRRLASMPSRAAARLIQRSSPNGVPRFTLVRRRSSSPSGGGAFTASAQSAGSGHGPAPRKAGEPPLALRPLKLDHGQFSAFRTNRARSGFRST